jgi:predicted ATPase
MTMTISETRKAVKLLGDKIERSETMSIDRGGYCVSVVFVGGWSRIFHSLDMVREWCLDHADF